MGFRVLAIVAIVLLGQLAPWVLAQTPKLQLQELARHFHYDRSTDFGVEERSLRQDNGIKIRDISYVSPRGGRVPAFVVEPEGTGPFAVVLWGHWMMKGSPMRNRGEFLEEAVVLARSGVVSILIDAPFVRPGFAAAQGLQEGADQASMVSQQQVVDFRRGLDLLLRRADVDLERVAFVGHSFNAHVGAILAGIENRIQSFVLMAGAFADEESVLNPSDPGMMRIRKQLGDDTIRAHFRDYFWDDPIRYLPHSAPSAVFLQFGREDQALTEEVCRLAFSRFEEPKRVAFYDAGHGLNAAARLDRAKWLANRLQLQRVDESALNAISELE